MHACTQARNDRAARKHKARLVKNMMSDHTDAQEKYCGHTKDQFVNSVSTYCDNSEEVIGQGGARANAVGQQLRRNRRMTAAERAILVLSLIRDAMVSANTSFASIGKVEGSNGVVTNMKVGDLQLDITCSQCHFVEAHFHIIAKQCLVYVTNRLWT